jgi:hypothetical protein
MDILQERNSWLISLAQFGAWIIASLGAIVDALYIRDFVDTLFSVIMASHNENFHRSGGVGLDLTFGYALTAYDEAMLFTLGIAAMALVIVIEYYFRRGRAKGLLFKRIGTVFGVELAIVAASILLRTIL